MYASALSGHAHQCDVEVIRRASSKSERFGALLLSYSGRNGAAGGTCTHNPPVKSRLYAFAVWARLITSICQYTKHFALCQAFFPRVFSFGLAGVSAPPWVQ